MIIHNYLPQKFMDTIIVPLIKSNTCDITNCDNYRPVSITCIISKIFELVILSKCSMFLYSSDNQFGYKKKHSTDQCIFILKELIDFNISSNTPLYTCFLDASKAFDRVNHSLLFDKLLRRGMPALIVRLLYTWYSSQEFYVKWCNIFSMPFKVSNGVRQGSNLSPVLFNVYLNELSILLNQTKVGCLFENVVFNHMFYADDVTLMAPSASALQNLINVCTEYGEIYDITYNTRKTVCMAFLPKYLKNYKKPQMYFKTKVLNWVDDFEYLGFLVSSDMRDNKDIRRQTRYIYAKGNVLFRKFYKCNDDFKSYLFKTYCYQMYCCQLWTNYSTTTFNSLKVAFNNVFRLLLKIPRQTSITKEFVCRYVDSFKVRLRKTCANFLLRLRNSDNSLLKTLTSSSFFILHSELHAKWTEMIF
jgi:hypothetical protein